MWCRVCGTREGVRRFNEQRQWLCPFCAEGMPPKITFSEFLHEAYFLRDAPYSTQREFYDDYMTSLDDVATYIRTR